MEVLDDRAAMLSNYEVMMLLQEKAQEDSSKKRNRRTRQENLATISYEVTKYLEKTACKVQNEEVIREFLMQLTPFNLTKGEKLQLLNLRPTTPVEIQLIIEESEDRLIIEESEDRLKTDEELEQLLQIVSLLPEMKSERNDNEMQEEGTS